ncbi:MAG: hypothetical protein DMG98_25335 [Acidobacteria bacterium]|nr:MAG: hypothetical protein DMG98_25335 [Acidobacteriota bacterium]
MYFYRARYYSPRTQRFISQDPIGFAGGDTNLYAYAFNSPTNFRDPSGRTGEIALGGCVFGPEGCAAGAAGEVLVDTGLATLALILAKTAASGPPAGAIPQTTPISTPADPNGRAPSGSGSCPSSPTNFDPDDTWGNPKTLADHFRNHGGDFGAASAEEYAQMASAFLQQALANGYPVKIDPSSGDILATDPTYNTFGAYKSNGTTKSFYKPDPAKHGFPTNKDYWNHQRGNSCP